VKRTTKLVAAGAIVGAAVAVASGVAVAGGGDDAEQAITGRALDQASAAALAHTGEGRVSDTEVGDEDSYYEVEVTLDDGSQVDVQLDKNFNVVDTKADRDGGEDDGANDD
jgi:hypothetical protein